MIVIWYSYKNYLNVFIKCLFMLFATKCHWEVTQKLTQSNYKLKLPKTETNYQTGYQSNMNKAIFRETKATTCLYFPLSLKPLSNEKGPGALNSIRTCNAKFITLHKRAINVYRCDFITNTWARIPTHLYVWQQKMASRWWFTVGLSPRRVATQEEVIASLNGKAIKGTLRLLTFCFYF